MSIGKRVSEAFSKMIGGDPEGAMFQVCATIEETAKRELGKGGRSNYKAFLRSNMDVICCFAFGTGLRRLYLGYTHPKIKGTADGSCSLEDIVYHAVRCGLYHTAALPSNLRFTKNVLGSGGDGILKLPETLIFGLVMSVVTSPANAAERCDQNYFVTAKDVMFVVNQWWGRAADLHKKVAELSNAPQAEVNQST